ncbi:MAG: D-tyrosyl-tRNA(Tyr) deacylase [Anaerolineaceae bacterium]|nr:D-tyrosyl-tRNA(Tyr) deacylase [Anaerolineaceae bacterium]
MRALVQRVSRGSVTVDEAVVAQIDHGLMVLLGIGPDDDEAAAVYLARKIANLRIFEDDAGKMNLSVQDVNGQVIVVSQFTLYADTRKGNRPAYVNAAPPEIASPMVDRFVELLRGQGVPTQSGVFGAHMVVDIQNDGPVTIMLEK